MRARRGIACNAYRAVDQASASANQLPGLAPNFLFSPYLRLLQTLVRCTRSVFSVFRHRDVMQMRGTMHCRRLRMVWHSKTYNMRRRMRGALRAAELPQDRTRPSQGQELNVKGKRRRESGEECWMRGVHGRKRERKWKWKWNGERESVVRTTAAYRRSVMWRRAWLRVIVQDNRTAREKGGNRDRQKRRAGNPGNVHMLQPRARARDGGMGMVLQTGTRGRD